MTLFIGYDPGGRGAHGVAEARICPDGSFLAEPELETFATAAQVQEWLQSRSDVKALGIDTLLAWSLVGGRACDDALRSRYCLPVIPQNSLYSSMTINGAMIAQEGKRRGLRLIESHPKLLIKTNVGNDPEARGLIARHQALVKNGASDKAARRADDMGDALVAAWCASRWWYRRWITDLFKEIDDKLIFPAGSAAYPWPEPIS